MTSKKLSSSWLGVAISMLVATSLLGQSAGTGALTGTVNDPSGAVVPGVSVILTSLETNQTRTAITGGDGSYKFSLLPPGNYRVRFSASGFRTAEISSVTVNVTETPVLDRTLEVGSQSDQVTVEATTELLQTASSTLGTTVASATVTSLPLSNRNYTQILALSAGTNAGANDATAFGKGTQDMSVNGNDPGQNSFEMDGVNINNFANAGSANDSSLYGGIGIPSPDAIAEFKIQTSLYDAGYGRNPGANVNVITKSGTNLWHGTAFEFFRNTDLNANDFFANRSGVGKQPLDQNQFGGVLGGPLKKDKLFIFGSFQYTTSKNAVDPTGFSSGATLPPIPLGDRDAPGFQAALGAAFCNQPTYSEKIGLGGVQVACNGSNINPVALAILRLKLPNGNYFIPSSTNGQYQTQTFIDPTTYSEPQYLVNGDYLVNSKNTIATRFFYSNEHQVQGFNCAIVPSTCLPGAGENNHFRDVNAVLRLTSILTNSLVNEAHMSFERSISDIGTNWKFTDSEVGITPVNPTLNVMAPITVLGLFDSGGQGEPSYDFNNTCSGATRSPGRTASIAFAPASNTRRTIGRSSGPGFAGCC